MSNKLDVIGLRNKGYRLTPQRLAILNILEEHEGHITPSDIFTKAKERIPGVTEATIYRTLDFLSHNRLILVAHIGNGHLVYESASHEHHHLICKTCGGTVQIEHELLNELYNTFQIRTGFQIDCSHVTFFGLCPKCQPDLDSIS